MTTTDWNFLWEAATGLLIDSNGDGCVDGVMAALAPLTPATFTADLWAAAANFAARLGLETPALHLPLAVPPAAVQPWQMPLLLSVGAAATARHGTPWADWVITETLVEQAAAQVSWLGAAMDRALWLHGVDAAALAQLLDQIATATPVSSTAGTSAPALATHLDLAQLYTSQPNGLFTAQHDGFTPDCCRLRLLLGPATDAAVGMAAINLAARIGLETAGLTLPLATAAPQLPADVADGVPYFCLGFPASEGDEAPGLTAQPQQALDIATLHYLAVTYPYVNAASRQAGDEQATMAALVARTHNLLHGHPQLVRLALAETQAQRSLQLHTAGADEHATLERLIFRHLWSPADGLDDVARVRRVFVEEVLPTLTTNAGAKAVITLFCNAQRPARQALAADLQPRLSAAGMSAQLQVLPAHKAGLAWLLEEQLPQLQQLPVASLRLQFQAFQPPAPPSPLAQPLDLPTRWLQELFPANELLCRRLGLTTEQLALEMVEPAPAGPIYGLAAYAADGKLLHHADLPLLTSTRLYMAGLPEYGAVHPTTGGIVVQQSNDSRQCRPVPTDLELFWDFYQGTVLPALRHHVLQSSQGRPTPESEPYFERLDVHVTLGGPDERLDLYEETISLGEALHEDIYFHTLDYLAALGETFGGRAIEAGGQVLPWIHDAYDANGAPKPATTPRAVVTLHGWHLPQTLPQLGLTVGDRRDLPKPQALHLSHLAIDATGQAVQAVTVTATYASAKEALFAARVLARWRQLVGDQTGFPAGVAVNIACVHADRTTTVCLPARAGAVAQRKPSPAPVTTASQIIGPDQLPDALAEVAALPGVQVWQVGHSYQGRPGHAIDVILPLEAHQTHRSRLKLGVQKPTCFLIARHHANEVSSTTAALQMVHAFATDPAQQAWLQRVNLVFLPMANPDGAVAHYRMMAEHPHWKHHAARFNAAGKEISRDLFNPNTPFGEARFRGAIWSRWLPDAMVDNHGVPSHEWCQPFAGYTTPPRFPVCYHVVQAMIYGIITFVDDPTWPQHRQAAEALRYAVTQAVAATPWLYARNQFWLKHYRTYGHNWLPALSPVDLHEGMLFFFQGVAPERQPATRRGFDMRYPQITLLDWITEVPDETAQGEYLAECAAAHRVANQAMIELVAKSAQPMTRVVCQDGEGVAIAWRRVRQIDR
ncbi:MAG: M14 family metallopeptidase [Caldilineaceae bacterium]